MQLPRRDPNGHVPVRRLWPGPRWERNAQAGAAPEALPFQTRDRKAELLAHHCRDWRYQLQKRPSAIG